MTELHGCRAGALQTSNNGQLQQDGRWDASHYGNLEQFIFDYLTGGTSAGETVRLKLQTPLFVAEALAQAAHRQLTDELQTATQVKPRPRFGCCYFCAAILCLLARANLRGMAYSCAKSYAKSAELHATQMLICSKACSV